MLSLKGNKTYCLEIITANTEAAIALFLLSKEESLCISESVSKQINLKGEFAMEDKKLMMAILKILFQQKVIDEAVFKNATNKIKNFQYKELYK